MKLLEEEEYEENALVEFCRNDADEEDIMRPEGPRTASTTMMTTMTTTTHPPLHKM